MALPKLSVVDVRYARSAPGTTRQLERVCAAANNAERKRLRRHWGVQSHATNSASGFPGMLNGVLNAFSQVPVEPQHCADYGLTQWLVNELKDAVRPIGWASLCERANAIVRPKDWPNSKALVEAGLSRKSMADSAKSLLLLLHASDGWEPPKPKRKRADAGKGSDVPVEEPDPKWLAVLDAMRTLFALRTRSYWPNHTTASATALANDTRLFLAQMLKLGAGGLPNAHAFAELTERWIPLFGALLIRAQGLEARHTNARRDLERHTNHRTTFVTLTRHAMARECLRWMARGCVWNGAKAGPALRLAIEKFAETVPHRTQRATHGLQTHRRMLVLWCAGR